MRATLSPARPGGGRARRPAPARRARPGGRLPVRRRRRTPLWEARVAARAAARANAVGADAGASAARDHLPPALERGVRVHAEPRGDVRVSVRVPQVLPAVSLGRVAATAHFGRRADDRRRRLSPRRKPRRGRPGVGRTRRAPPAAGSRRGRPGVGRAGRVPAACARRRARDLLGRRGAGGRRAGRRGRRGRRARAPPGRRSPRGGHGGAARRPPAAARRSALSASTFMSTSARASRCPSRASLSAWRATPTPMPGL